MEGVTSGQVLLAVVVVIVSAWLLQGLLGASKAGDPDNATEAGQSEVSETPDETQAETAGEDDKRKHALPVRVLYASELGTAKGRSSLCCHCFTMLAWRWVFPLHMLAWRWRSRRLRRGADA